MKLNRTRFLIAAGVLASCVALLLLRDHGDLGDLGDSAARVVEPPVETAADAKKEKHVASESEVRHRTALALTRISDGDESERVRAVAALRRLGAPALAALREALANEEGGDERYAAAFALAVLGGPEAKGLVADMFLDEKFDPPPLLAAAAAELQDPRLATEFLQLVSSSDRKVRQAAARALRASDFPHMGDLLPLLADGEPSVRREAERALVFLLPKMEPNALKHATESAVASKSPEMRAAGLRLCIRIDRRWACDLAAKATTDSNVRVRAEAMHTLARLGDRSASEPLVRVLKGGVSRLEKVRAANALSAVEATRGALDALAAVAGGKDPIVALAASRALVARGDTRGIPALLRLHQVKESKKLNIDHEDAGLLAGLSRQVLSAVATDRRSRRFGESWDKWWKRVEKDFRFPNKAIIPEYPANH